MRLLLGSLINTVPAGRDLDDYVTATLPPLAPTPDGEDIDYSLLLLAEQFVVDRASLDYLLAQPDPDLRGIGKSIEILRREGLVDLFDFQESLKSFQPRIDRASNLAAQNPHYWLDGIRQHILKYDQVRPSLRKVVRERMSPWDELIFPLANYLVRRDGTISAVSAKRLSNAILHKDFDAMKPGERKALQGIIAESIGGVAGQALVAEAAGAHHYSWRTCDHMFDMLASFVPNTRAPIESHMRGCRDFFRIAFPEYAPKSREDWLRLLRHKDVQLLRDRIARAVAAGDTIDADFARKTLDARLRSVEGAKRSKTLIGRGVDGFGLLAGAAAGIATGGGALLPGLIAGTAVSVGGIAAKETADQIIDHDADTEFRWMYFRSADNN